MEPCRWVSASDAIWRSGGNSHIQCLGVIIKVRKQQQRKRFSWAKKKYHTGEMRIVEQSASVVLISSEAHGKNLQRLLNLQTNPCDKSCVSAWARRVPKCWPIFTKIKKKLSEKASQILPAVKVLFSTTNIQNALIP